MNNLAQKIIKPKLGVLELAKQLGNVSNACKALGYSRDTVEEKKFSIKYVKYEKMKHLNKNGGPNVD